VSEHTTNGAPANAHASTGAVIVAPLGVEATAVRGAGRTVLRTGMGPEHARRFAFDPRLAAASGVAVAGACGSLVSEVGVGDVVVATEVRHQDGTVARRCLGAGMIVAELERRGVRVHAGPIVTVDRVAVGDARDSLAADGAIAVDMESAWLSGAAPEKPFVVVRAVSDGPGRELSLRRPLRSASGGIAALRALGRAGPAIDAWSRALMPKGRRVLLAGPRSFCAGVARAVEIVERALDRHGPPVYVRKQIVHNVHVVHDLEARGAVFVDEVDEVPEGAMVIFSAHGVSPEVRRKADDRQLAVIDATCPLVTKVHAEAKRFARNGYTIFLVGHEGHEEVEGTTGEAPDAIRLIDPAGAADAMEGVEDPKKVAFLTQTTLAVDEVRSVVGGLRERFPSLAGPGSDDICYATQNRQDAVKAIAAECDVLLAIGSDNSSNSKRLVEVAERAGCSAYLIDDGGDIRLEWLAGAATIGLTAGASAPDTLARDVIAELEGLGPVAVEHRTIDEEDVRFTLPVELRR
jgi:4-hydroxy-3-methylbut-2-enyl diphosphate reductase